MTSMRQKQFAQCSCSYIIIDATKHVHLYTEEFSQAADAPHRSNVIHHFPIVYAIQSRYHLATKQTDTRGKGKNNKWKQNLLKKNK